MRFALVTAGGSLLYIIYGESAAEIESRPPWQPRCL